MSDEKRCEHCKHYIVRHLKRYIGVESWIWRRVPICTLGRKLEPCEFFEREPGSDDDE